MRVSADTGDKRTAVAIGRMVDDLAERGSTDVLDPVCNRRIDLLDVWASYRLDAKLVDVRTALDDVDLEPLVGQWAKALRSAGLASADKHEAQVRVLIPAGKRFNARRAGAARAVDQVGASRAVTYRLDYLSRLYGAVSCLTERPRRARPANGRCRMRKTSSAK